MDGFSFHSNVTPEQFAQQTDAAPAYMGVPQPPPAAGPPIQPVIPVDPLAAAQGMQGIGFAADVPDWMAKLDNPFAAQQAPAVETPQAPTEPADAASQEKPEITPADVWKFLQTAAPADETPYEETYTPPTEAQMQEYFNSTFANDPYTATRTILDAVLAGYHEQSVKPLAKGVMQTEEQTALANLVGNGKESKALMPVIQQMQKQYAYLRQSMPPKDFARFVYNEAKQTALPAIVEKAKVEAKNEVLKNQAAAGFNGLGGVSPGRSQVLAPKANTPQLNPLQRHVANVLLKGVAQNPEAAYAVMLGQEAQ